MIPAANDLTLTLLGPQYKGAGSLVQIIVMAVPSSMIASLCATVCNVRGRVLTRLLQQIVLSPIMWLAVFFAAPWGLRSIAGASVILKPLRMVAFSPLRRSRLASDGTTSSPPCVQVLNLQPRSPVLFASLHTCCRRAATLSV